MPSRFKVQAALMGLGVVAGAAAGGVLTYLGNVITGYPIPPSLGTYLWNAGIMAGIGGTAGPPLAWALLRRAPLWRALAEPAAAGVVGSAASMLFAPALFPLIAPLSIFAAALRLRYAYRPSRSRLPDSEAPELIAD